MSEIAGFFIGLLLTLFIYSYLVGDNPLYRFGVHILVGVSAAYAAIIVVEQVILPGYKQIQADPGQTNILLWLVPTLLGLLLLLKRLPAVGWVGNSTIALLVGIGAAVALTGTINGTLLPQITAFAGSGNGAHTGKIQNIVVALFTTATLIMFQFSGSRGENNQWARPRWLAAVSNLGRGVLMVTFGALFASVLNTSLILLSERISYYMAQFQQLLP